MIPQPNCGYKLGGNLDFATPADILGRTFIVRVIHHTNRGRDYPSHKTRVYGGPSSWAVRDRCSTVCSLEGVVTEQLLAAVAAREHL